MISFAGDRTTDHRMQSWNILRFVVADLISCWGDHGIHCWCNLIRSKQWFCVLCAMFVKFSGHGNSIYNIIPLLKKKKCISLDICFSFQGISFEDAVKIRKTNVNPALFTFYKHPVFIYKGYMQWLWDTTGKRYLDMFAGIVTVSVGHCHPWVWCIVC